VWSVVAAVLLGLTMGVVSTNTDHGGTTLGALTVLAGTGGLAALGERDRAGLLLTAALVGFLAGGLAGVLVRGAINGAHRARAGASPAAGGDRPPARDDDPTATAGRAVASDGPESTGRDPASAAARATGGGRARSLFDLVVSATAPRRGDRPSGIFVETGEGAADGAGLGPLVDALRADVARLEARLDDRGPAIAPGPRPRTAREPDRPVGSATPPEPRSVRERGRPIDRRSAGDAPRRALLAEIAAAEGPLDVDLSGFGCPSRDDERASARAPE
jgi:hypothetical protein